MIIKNLKRLRKVHRLTGEQVAKALNVSSSCYRNYEIGKREPSLEMLIKIAQFYEVSTDYLLGLDSTPQHSSVEIISSRYGLSEMETKILRFYMTLESREREQVITGIDCIKNNSKSVNEVHLSDSLKEEEENLKSHKLKQKRE